ncbi:hypothetical protein Q6249_28120, partial [Klebsiella pneumoniae]|nr:hypothetical protein [Klebsiella pneumoniae]
MYVDLTTLERHHGQKVTQVMVAGRDQLETAFTVAVEPGCWAAARCCGRCWSRRASAFCLRCR